MHEYWERRLAEARKIKQQIETEFEVALSAVAPEAAEPVRAVIGAASGAPFARRRYGRAAGQTPNWSNRRRSDQVAAPMAAPAPRSPRQLQIAVVPRSGDVPGPASAVAVSASRPVRPLWYGGALAAIYALGANLLLYAALVASGAVERIPGSEALPAVLAVTSVLCAATGTVAFGLLRDWVRWPETAFRLLSGAGVVVLLVSFVVSPGATFLAAILAIVATALTLASEPISG